MDRNLIEELKEKEFKDITFGLYNKIDDDYFPQYLSKRDKTIYGIDDFEYCNLDFDKKEQFLIKMHNKDILNTIKCFKKEIEEKDYKVIVDYLLPSVTVIRLKLK